MKKDSRKWLAFLALIQATYTPLILIILQQNMDKVAEAVEKEDKPENVLIYINSLITAQAMATFLLAMYMKVGTRWAVEMWKLKREKDNVRDPINRENVSAAIRRSNNPIAVKRAFDIIHTQRKRASAIIQKGVDEGKPKEEIAKDIRQAPTTPTQAALVSKTEAVFSANKAIIEAERLSPYVHTKTWWSMHDNRVRDPQNPYYKSPPRFSHMNVHGQTLPMDMPFLDTLGYIQYPGDAEAQAGNICNCRCWLQIEVLKDAQGKPIRKGTGITVIMPPGANRPQPAQEGGITVIRPTPNITVIRPGDIPRRPTITI